jgi:hypothetical protein
MFELAAVVALLGTAAPPAIWKVPGAIEQSKDCADCPQMIVVPAGESRMGSPNSEMHRGAEAQQRITITPPFAVSKFEITFDEWARCGWGLQRLLARRRKLGSGPSPRHQCFVARFPGLCGVAVSETGKTYLLLSEAK